jgi:hypothetical protein
MICEKCGHNDQIPEKDEWCMYQVKDGLVINQMFHPDRIPKGWFDSPKAAKSAKKPRAKKATNAGLTIGGSDGNSTGFNQLSG